MILRAKGRPSVLRNVTKVLALIRKLLKSNFSVRKGSIC